MRHETQGRGLVIISLYFSNKLDYLTRSFYLPSSLKIGFTRAHPTGPDLDGLHAVTRLQSRGAPVSVGLDHTSVL